MENYYQSLISDAVKSIWIKSNTDIYWMNDALPSISKDVLARMDIEKIRNYKIMIIKNILYTNFYSLGQCVKISSLSNKGFQSTGNLSKLLSEHNKSQGFFDEGWEIDKVVDDDIFVKKDGLTICTIEDELEKSSLSFEKGTIVKVKHPKESFQLSPGFHFAFSNQEFTHNNGKIVRFYWNIKAEGACKLIEVITTFINDANIPFNFKVINDTNHFNRCDAAVLYIKKEDYQSFKSLLEVIYPKVAKYLLFQSPLFTKFIAPGLGLAEDPIGEESFGELVCNIIATGVITAYESGQTLLDEQIKHVVDCFRLHDIIPDFPYLNPSSEDIYEVLKIKSENKRVIKPSITNETLNNIDTAMLIANYFIENAIWHKDKCNWIDIESNNHIKRKKNVLTTLSPNLYDGTSGISIFLSELYHLTGDSEIKKTALGAINHAIFHLERLHNSNLYGFYVGISGILLSAIKIGSLLKEPRVTEKAFQLSKKYLTKKPFSKDTDLLTGIAGTLIATTTIYKTFNDNTFKLMSQELGEELLKRAEVSEKGYSWSYWENIKQQNLTGFSHGTSGIAYTLLHLYELNKNNELKRAIEESFKYEANWFNSAIGNWADLREFNIDNPNQELLYSNYWCHGSPGMSISMIKAYEVFKEEKYRKQALIALKTTKDATISWLKDTLYNYSLCHGYCGNSLIISYGKKILGIEFELQKKASDIEYIKTDIIKLISNNLFFDNGTNLDLGLMTGLSGIGLFFISCKTNDTFFPLLPSYLQVES